ncbi:hypothetical protein F2P81_007587 [Scophthalmus maximus]|uniref:Cadherin domain-containing protein n=1 Tax=Scophthalmus maximus TaxID=52904 RepID=A0A6A4TB02_SCOMX|nr:hypothetical protein F2P81_007587 [Scophthalmus maximus]
MEQRGRQARSERTQCVAFMVVLVTVWSRVSAQVRYSVAEEVKEGTAVGNIAKDLGLDKTTLKERGYRIVYSSTEPPFQVNQGDGILYVNRKIDREEVCDRSKVCVIDLKTVLENPLEVHYVAVEILDVNDHAPSFPEREKMLDIFESALPGARFQLQAARDADSGSLSVQQYKLSHNEHFRLDVKDRVMEQRGEYKSWRERRCWFAFLVVLDVLWSGAVAQIRYSISEEVEDGTVVGNIAKDLGLDKSALKDRGYRIVSGSGEPLFQVNEIDGVLYVKRRIDREEVCERTSPCLIQLKTVLENPLEIHYVAVEILDINDHSPVFPEKEKRLEISESALAGARFQLQAARDPDVGQFSIQQYRLSHNEHFRVEVKDRGQDRKVPFLVLQKQLDREAAGKHRLRLTAVDGGKPVKSGSIDILVDVIDINDNSPVFTKELYSATLKENVPLGTVVIQVNATDLDQGANGEIIYSFGNEVDVKLMDPFSIDPNTGEIQVTGPIDFEKSKSYEIDIKASDKGQVPLASDKSVMITVIDVNDNAPEIEVTSFSSSIKEDAKIGTTVALISVSDLDSGINGKIICTIKEDVPFILSPSLQENMYAVVTKSQLDREEISQYDVTITAKDSGDPSFLTEKTISVVISDVNDNSPEFSISPYTFYISENNSPAAPVFSVKASDRDESDNALISYHICRDERGVANNRFNIDLL